MADRLTFLQREYLLTALAQAGWWYVKPLGEAASFEDGIIAGPSPGRVRELAQNAGCVPMEPRQVCLAGGAHS